MFGFVWEGVVGSIPGDVPKLSVIYYLRSILQGQIGTGPLHDFGSKASSGVAAAGDVGVTLPALICRVLLVHKEGVRPKARVRSPARAGAERNRTPAIAQAMNHECK